MNKTYEIAAENLNSLTTRLDKLNARLAKIGAQTFTYAVGARKDVIDPQDANKVHQFVTVVLDIPAPVANEWEFQATIVHTAEGNIIRALPGVEVPPVHRDGAPHCDHCNTNRLRRDTYVVRNQAGVTKQVGSTCLGEFLGHKTPHLLCAAVEYLFDAETACEEAREASTPATLSTYRIPTLRYLEFVAATVFKTGRYVTRKLAAEQGNAHASTASYAYDWMFHRVNTPDVVQYDAQGQPMWAEPTDEAKALASAALNWVLNRYAPALPLDADPMALKDAIMAQFSVRQELSDFEHNLLSVARAQAIEPRLCGIAAYIIEAYRRSQPRKEAVQLNGGFTRIFEIFTTATKNLKRPAIVLSDDQGRPISMSLAGAQSRNAGYIYVKGGRGGDYYGKISPEGRFFSVPACPPSVEAQLKAFGDNPEDMASKHGKLTGRCCFCNRPLCDERSTEVGYGPVCADNFGLKWGTRSIAAITPVTTEATVAA